MCNIKNEHIAPQRNAQPTSGRKKENQVLVPIPKTTQVFCNYSSGQNIDRRDYNPYCHTYVLQLWTVLGFFILFFSNKQKL